MIREALGFLGVVTLVAEVIVYVDGVGGWGRAGRILYPKNGVAPTGREVCSSCDYVPCGKNVYVSV